MLSSKNRYNIRKRTPFSWISISWWFIPVTFTTIMGMGIDIDIDDAAARGRGSSAGSLIMAGIASKNSLRSYAIV
jgi:hypothetical protein